MGERLSSTFLAVEQERVPRSATPRESRDGSEHSSRDESGHVDDCGGCGSTNGARPKRAIIRDMCQVPLGSLSSEITADSVRSTIFSAKRRLDDAMHLLDQKLAELEHERTMLWRARAELEHDRLNFQEEKELFYEEMKRMADANARNTEIVKLNVGGSRFETTRATLTQFPDSMLGTMFSGRHVLKADSDGYVFIDRSPVYFSYILDYLRSGGQNDAQLPADELERERIKDEFDFFMLPTEATPLANSNSRPVMSLYDVVAENDILSLEGNTAEICDVKIVDKYVITCGMDNHVRMWDLTNGQLVRDLDDHPDSVSCMACTSLTHVVTGCLDNKVRLWNLEEGQMVRVLYSHVDWVRVTACTINHAASSSEDGTIIVWDLNLDTQVLLIPDAHPWNVCLHEETVINVSTGGAINVWNLVTGTCVRSLSADGFFPRNIRLRDGILASSNVYGSVVRLWDVTTGEILRSVRVANGEERFALIDFSEDILVGACIGVGVGSTILVDMHTGHITALPEHKGAVYDANLQGLTLASGGVDGVVKVWGAKYRTKGGRLSISNATTSQYLHRSSDGDAAMPPATQARSL